MIKKLYKLFIIGYILNVYKYILKHFKRSDNMERAYIEHLKSRYNRVKKEL